MLARSIVWNLEHVNDCLDALHSQPQLCGRTETIDRSRAARQALFDTIELFKGSSPPEPTDPAKRLDDELQSVLAVMYAEKTTRRDVLRDKLSGATLDALRASGQIRIGHEEVFVPLDGVAGNLNWYVVYRFLLERVGRFVTSGRRLLDKLRAERAESTAQVTQLIRSLVERLQTTWQCFRRQLGRLQALCATVSIGAKIDVLLSKLAATEQDGSCRTPRAEGMKLE